MNVYRICLKVKREILYRSDFSYENPKHVWLVSESLIKAATWAEKNLESRYSDFYLEDIRTMGKAEIDEN